MSNYAGEIAIRVGPNYDGGVLGGGGGGEVELLCADKLYAQELFIGECENPLYGPFPTEAPDANQIITTRDVFVLPEGAPSSRRLFIMGYQLGPVFKPNEFVEIPAGTYGLIELLELARAGIQALIEVDIVGAVLSYAFVGGKVEWSANLGITLYSGNASQVPPNHNVNHRFGATTSYIGNPILYPFEPKFDDRILKFTGNKFNDTGDVYEGENLTISNNLIINGSLVSELKTNDAIVECANNQPTDTLTTGWTQLNTNNTFLSGLLRDGSTKAFHLFNNSPIASIGPGLPAPAGNGTLDLSTLKISSIQGKGTLLDLSLAGASRVNINSVNTYMRAPNETTAVTTTNNEIIHSVQGTPRIQADTSETFIQSPDEASYIYVDDGSSAIYCDDGSDFSELSLNGTEMVFNKGGFRLRCNPTLSELRAPNAVNRFEVTNAKIVQNFNGLERTFINGTQNLSIAPGNLTQSIIRDTEIELLCDFGGDSSSFFVRPTTGAWNIDSVNRLDFTAVQTAIKAVNQNGLYVTNNNTNLRYGIVQRVAIDGAASLMRSPDELSIVNVENGTAELTYQTNWIQVQPTKINATLNSIERLTIDTTESTITAPNDTEELTVKDEGLFYKRTGIPQQNVPLGQAVQISNVTVNGTANTAIMVADVGTTTFPANTWKVGDTYHIKIGGIFTAALNDTITIYLNSGIVPLATSGAITIPANVSNTPFEIEIDFTIRALGATSVGVLNVSGDFTYNRGSPSFAREGQNWNVINNSTFETTISNTLNVSVQQSAAGQSITSYNFYLTQTY